MDEMDSRAGLSKALVGVSRMGGACASLRTAPVNYYVMEQLWF